MYGRRVHAGERGQFVGETAETKGVRTYNIMYNNNNNAAVARSRLSEVALNPPRAILLDGILLCFLLSVCLSPCIIFPLVVANVLKRNFIYNKRGRRSVCTTASVRYERKEKLFRLPFALYARVFTMFGSVAGPKPR